MRRHSRQTARRRAGDGTRHWKLASANWVTSPRWLIDYDFDELYGPLYAALALTRELTLPKSGNRWERIKS